MEYKNGKNRRVEKVNFEPGEKNLQIRNVYTKNGVKYNPNAPDYAPYQKAADEKVAKEYADKERKAKEKKMEKIREQQKKSSFTREVRNFNAMRMHINSKVYNQLHEKDKNENEKER